MGQLATVVSGDATVASSYREALGGTVADLLLTDPPYCLLTRRRRGGELRDPKHRKIERDPIRRFESVREYQRFTELWLDLAVAHLRADAPMIVWTNFLGRQPLLRSAERLGYGQLWGEFAWAKQTRETAGERLLRVYEVALVLARAPPPAPGPADPSPVWAVISGYDDDGSAARHGDHPHHKPAAALEPLIRAHSRPGMIVLDPFGGSGSIPAVALSLGRGVACIEQRPDWAARIRERLRSTASAVDARPVDPDG